MIIYYRILQNQKSYSTENSSSAMPLKSSCTVTVTSLPVSLIDKIQLLGVYMDDELSLEISLCLDMQSIDSATTIKEGHFARFESVCLSMMQRRSIALSLVSTLIILTCYFTTFLLKSYNKFKTTLLVSW